MTPTCRRFFFTVATRHRLTEDIFAALALFTGVTSVYNHSDRSLLNRNGESAMAASPTRPHRCIKTAPVWQQRARSYAYAVARKRHPTLLNLFGDSGEAPRQKYIIWDARQVATIGVNVILWEISKTLFSASPLVSFSNIPTDCNELFMLTQDASCCFGRWRKCNAHHAGCA